jgi:CRP-like cAMP-binding protein
MLAARRRTNTFAIPFSREELAAFLCVNRSALSHELSLMKQEKLITFRKNTFTLLHRTQEME